MSVRLTIPTAEWPTKCADVRWEMGDEECMAAVDGPHTGLRDWEIGDLVYDPKVGEGHILVGTKTCGEDGFYCGYCAGMLTDRTYGGYCGPGWKVCQCGEFDVGDHHGFLLARKP